MEYKGYKIVSDRTFGNRLIKTVGPGKLPMDLSGAFTSDTFAMKAIDRYVSKKDVVNGKSGKGSG